MSCHRDVTGLSAGVIGKVGVMKIELNDTM